MIIKFEQYNENIKSLLVGPTKDEIWRNLGYDKIFSRTFETPEEFFLYMIDGIKIKEQTEYPDSVFWEKNGEILFEKKLKNKILYVKYYTIWSVFEKFFNFNYDETQRFIKEQVEEHLNWNGFTPYILSTKYSFKWNNI